ncbi:MAG: O-methyltransferase, partial [Actinomycetota bacterium]
LPARVLSWIYTHPVALPPRKHLETEGGQTVEGLYFLVSLVRALRARHVFEIGTFNGVTAWALAENMDGGNLRTLDLPPERGPALDVEKSDHTTREAFEEHLYKQLEHRSQIAQLWGDSATFDFSPWYRECDVVYVDGAHSEPYVRSDTGHAFELLAPGGVIVWDDYWRQVHGVPAVLNELARERRLYRVPSTRLVVYLDPGCALMDALPDH